MAAPQSVQLVFFMLYYFQQLSCINALTIKTSIDHQYENKTIHCNATEPCVVICQNIHACRRTTIHCPTAHPCDVICNSSWTCAQTIIHAKDASFFQLLDCATGTWTCIGITIYFPTNNPGIPLSKLIGADLGLSAGPEAKYPLQFYAADGWNDMNITPIDYFSFAGDLNVGTMYCLNDYSVACNFSLTAWSCANPDDFCNDPYTLSPTGSTINPSTAPTLAPSIDPTKNPTQAPSIHPSENPTTKPPSSAPTQLPTQPSIAPTAAPTLVNPTSKNPTEVTKHPTLNPTKHPTTNPSKYSTLNPTKFPSLNPTKYPTSSPTKYPTNNPSEHPTSTQPTEHPTLAPTKYPTTITPTTHPTFTPSHPTFTPSLHPIISTKYPSIPPTTRPASDPSIVDIIRTTFSEHKPSSPFAKLPYFWKDPELLLYGIIILCALSFICIIIMLCCFCKSRQNKNKLAPPDSATIEMRTKDGFHTTHVTQTGAEPEDSDYTPTTREQAAVKQVNDAQLEDDDEAEVLSMNPHHFQKSGAASEAQYTLPFASNFEQTKKAFPHIAHYAGKNKKFSDDTQVDGYQANLYDDQAQNAQKNQCVSVSSSMYYNAGAEEKQSRIAPHGAYLADDEQSNTWVPSLPAAAMQQEHHFGGYLNTDWNSNPQQGFNVYQNVQQQQQQYQGQGQYYGGYPPNAQHHEQRQFVGNAQMQQLDEVDERIAMQHQ